MIPSQKYCHYIHGPKAAIHVIESNRGGKLNEKINEIVESELELLDLQDNTKNNGNGQMLSKQEDFQIVRMNNQKVKSKWMPTRNVTLDGDLESCSEKIRYCYSREWAAVVGLISIDKKTIYREFLTRVYLAASRARVYFSLILYVEHGSPPHFLRAFLKKVESGSSSIVKKYVVKRILPKEVKSAASLLSKRMRLDKDHDEEMSSSQQEDDMESS